MTSSNRPPESESELVELLATLRVAPPGEDHFLEQLRSRLEVETLPREIPGARILPLRRKVPRLVVVAAALALAGAAAAATLQLVRETPKAPATVPPERPAAEHGKVPQRNEMPRHETTKPPSEPERPTRLAPRARENHPTPVLDRTDVPTPSGSRAPERATPVPLERLELKRQSEIRTGETSASPRPLERTPADRSGSPSDLERTGPDRSLQKVGPGGLSREERMGQEAPVERRPGGAPAP